MPRIAPSRGTHLILDQADLPMGRAACIVPAGEGRMIFALPWYGRTLVGTTDNDFDGDTEHPRPGGEDVAYLLDAVNEFFGTSLTQSDLVGAYAGVRPLISTGDPRKSVDISRKAELYETSSGMLTITGGKLTTWRRMAKQTVDRLVEREGREAPCHTAEIPLGMEARAEDLEAPEGVGEESVSQLAFRYGHAARAVLDLACEDPKLARPIVPGRPDLLAEVAIAARREQARSVADVLLRRTRLGILAAPQLRDAASVATGRRGARRRAGLVAAPGQARGGGLAGGGGAGGHRPRRGGLNNLRAAMNQGRAGEQAPVRAARAGRRGRGRALPDALATELIGKLADGAGSGAGVLGRARALRPAARPPATPPASSLRTPKARAASGRQRRVRPQRREPRRASRRPVERERAAPRAPARSNVRAAQARPPARPEPGASESPSRPRRRRRRRFGRRGKQGVTLQDLLLPPPPAARRSSAPRAARPARRCCAASPPSSPASRRAPTRSRC